MPDRINCLIADHRRMLLRFIVRIGQRHEHAEDIFQETMVRAWRHLDTLPRDPDSERRWLFAVARHLVVDSERRRRIRPPEVTLTETATTTTGDDHTSATVIARDSLHSAFHALAPMHQNILRELYYEGHSVADISRRLGIPPGTVKSRAHYGMRSLREAVAA